MIQDQFMSFFWNQMVARQQNKCQLHINVKCSNHYMSTYTGCAASSAAEHKARERQWSHLTKEMQNLGKL